ncbi:6503_t:CDS:2, partial [Cetraspora pellucida]
LAGTGKSYMIHLLLKDLQRMHYNYLLLILIKVAIQNELNNYLIQIDTLIIEEVSMIDLAQLPSVSGYPVYQSLI